MKRFFFVLILASASLWADDLPAIRSIIKRFVQESGGDAFLKATSMVSTGEVEFVGTGIQGKLTIYAATPNKTRMTFDIPQTLNVKQTLKMTTGSSGDTAWDASPIMGIRAMEGKEKRLTLLTSRMDFIPNFEAYFPIRSLQRNVELEGRVCDCISLTAEGLDPMLLWFDVETGLLAAQEATLDGIAGRIVTRIVTRETKQYGDLRLPSKLMFNAMQMQVELRVSEVSTNVQLPESLFAFPEDLHPVLALDAEGRLCLDGVIHTSEQLQNRILELQTVLPDWKIPVITVKGNIPPNLLTVVKQSCETVLAPPR